MQKTTIFNWLFSLLLLGGCASLKKEVDNNIYPGDSADHLVEVLGKPDKVGPSQRVKGALAWSYVRRSELCNFRIKDKMVDAISCGSRPGYVSPLAIFGMALQGAGQGLSHAQDNTYNCTDWGYGHYTCTNQGRTYNCTSFGNSIQCN